MRYISEIVGQVEGSVDYLNYDMWSTHDGRFYAMIADTDKPGVVIKVGGDMIPYKTDVLGFSDSALETCWTVVKNSAKTALLHLFIEEAVTSYVMHSEAFAKADRCTLYWGDEAHFDAGEDGDTIVVESINEAFLCFGKSGSVAVRRANFSEVSQVCTLYDMLGQACNLTRLNLMRYRKLYFINKNFKTKTFIRLRHDTESELFFTKMYFDVCGGRK